MAAAASPMPPPPGGAPPSAPTSPVAASPAPAKPSPQLEKGSQLVIAAVQAHRAIAQQFPATAPIMSQINDLMRQAQLKMMQGAQPSEAPAPPVNG
jgi:hypothetical protein